MGICIDNDQKLQNAGVWTEFKGSWFLCVYSTNLAFQRKLARLQQPHRRSIDLGTLDPGTAKELLIKAIVGTLLIGWKEVVDGNGNDVEFDEHVAIRALSNNDDLLDYIRDFTVNLANFRDDQIESAEKSLPNT